MPNWRFNADKNASQFCRLTWALGRNGNVSSCRVDGGSRRWSVCRPHQSLLSKHVGLESPSVFVSEPTALNAGLGNRLCAVGRSPS